jgi:hypothetical protein
MNILHYIPKITQGELVSDGLLTLVAAMKEVADVQVVTQRKEAETLLKEQHPDIFHIHACWSREAARVAKQAYKEGVAIVISPHWQLEQYIRMREQHICKVCKTALYQYKMIHRADALQVSTDLERDNLLFLGWNKRCTTVPSSLLNKNVSYQQMAETMLVFYQKVIDSRYYKLMTAMEKEAVSSLLHVGKEKDMIRNPLTSDQILNLRDIKPVQWRRIMLYADDEYIRNILDVGISRMQLTIPTIDAASIDRFPRRKKKSSEPLERKELLNKKSSLQDKLKWETEGVDDVIKTICIMLLNIKYHIQKRTLSMRHLTEFYEVLRHEDYDEDKLQEVLKYMKLKDLASRLIQILSNTVLLEEGFMPITPLDDKKTHRIKQLIIH